MKTTSTADLQSNLCSPGSFSPAVVATRAALDESVHFAAIAIVTIQSTLVASLGDPGLIAYMRSSSKPLQALPLVENGGVEAFNLTLQEIALMCASHEGSDEHVRVVKEIQAKTGVAESDLLCGTHPVSNRATADAMLFRGEEPTPNRHNCSGKHTGFLSQAVLRNLPKENYLEPSHPVQQTVINTFSEMVNMDPDAIHIGIDGCSAPVFALPLYNSALGIARLCDPQKLSPTRAAACKTITSAMTQFPQMVAGEGIFDTRLMQIGQGKIISKRGAEGYQIIGLLPGAIAPDSPALGIAMKVADGDPKERARPLMSLEVLRQLGALSPAQFEQLANFDRRPLINYRKIEVGMLQPVFRLDFRTAWKYKPSL